MYLRRPLYRTLHVLYSRYIRAYTNRTARVSVVILLLITLTCFYRNTNGDTTGIFNTIDRTVTVNDAMGENSNNRIQDGNNRIQDSNNRIQYDNNMIEYRNNRIQYSINNRIQNSNNRTPVAADRKDIPQEAGEQHYGPRGTERATGAGSRSHMHVLQESLHARVMDILARYPKVEAIVEGLFLLLEPIRYTDKYYVIMVAFDGLVLDLWQYYRPRVGGRAGRDRRSSWQTDDERRHEINCSNIHQLTIQHRLGAGFIKSAYRADFHGRSVAVKVKNMKYINNREFCTDEFECCIERDVRLLNEVILLGRLRHPMFNTLLGFCVHNGGAAPAVSPLPGVIAVYELGRRIYVRDEDLMTFNDSLHHALAFADFLDYAEHSPFGRLNLIDLHREQFVRVGRHYTLTDMDVANNRDDPACYDVETRVKLYPSHMSTVCVFHKLYSINYSFEITCVDGKCLNFGQKHNMHRIYELIFVRIFDLAKVPAQFRMDIGRILGSIRRYIPAATLYDKLKEVQMTSVDTRYSNIHQLTIQHVLGAGFIKSAYLADFHGRSVAVKVKNMNVINNRKFCTDEFECCIERDVRLLNELILLGRLRHPMFNTLLGFCVHNGGAAPAVSPLPGVIVVYELGRRIYVRDDHMMTFNDSLHHALAFADFLDYAEHSPFGRLNLIDLHREQFVRVGRHYTLTDMDIANNKDDPACYDVETRVKLYPSHMSTVCVFHRLYSIPYSFEITCVDGKCLNFGQKHNMHRIYELIFVRIFDLAKVPAQFRMDIGRILGSIRRYIPAATLYDKLKEVQVRHLKINT